jgi:hypothetical protein
MVSPRVPPQRYAMDRPKASIHHLRFLHHLLTIDGRMSTITNRNRRSNVFYGKTYTETRRSSARHPRHVGLAYASLWTCSRASDRKAHSKDYERFPADAARLPVPRFAPARTKRLGCLQMGNCSRSQSGIQILQANGERQETTHGGGVKVETNGGRRGTSDVACNAGELK